MKLTTGYDFQGYYITEYLDVIFDEMLVGLGLGKTLISGLDNIFSAITGTEATEMINKLNNVKQQLRERVIAKARKIGANALIGIDFESSKIGDLIMVSMTATAVRIDRIVSPLPCTESEQKKLDEENKKAAELEQKKKFLKELEENPELFNHNIFLEKLKEFKTTKEMVGYIESNARKHPGVFSEDLLRSLNGCMQIERMYGAGTGSQKVINIMRDYFKE